MHEGIGASLEDDANHADGHAHTLEHEALVQLATQQRVTHWVGQTDGLVDACADIGQLVLVEAQALDHGRCHTLTLRGLEVGGVRREDLVGMGKQGLFDACERVVALLDRRRRHHGALELHTGGDFADLAHGASSR